VKRIILFAFLVMTIIPGIAYANNFYIEGLGNYGDYKDLKKMTGYGAGIGMSITPQINAFFKFYMASGGKTSQYYYGTPGASDLYKDNYKYEQKVWMVTGDYNIPFRSIPMVFVLSGGAGLCDVSAKYDSEKLITTYGNPVNPNSDYQENGIFLGAWVGARYYISQKLGVYALAGYQMATGFKGDFNGAKINGWQLMMGVTYTFIGDNASLTSGY
jgi:hypothetical protein